MEQEKKKVEKSPVQWILEFAAPSKGKFYQSVILAVLGVACGMVPYFAAAQIIIGLLAGRTDFGHYGILCMIMLAGYAGKTLFANWSTSISHRATFETLAQIRSRLTAKLTRVPMGYILDTPYGQLKDILVEKVESIETTLAHLVPELTSNLLVPVCIIVYLFVLDWRMALASLITLPLGFLCYMGMMRGYAERWGNFIKARNHMQSTTIEYVNGIEVIKAFNQSAGSYEKYRDAVNNNLNTVIKWMRDTQVFSSMGFAVWPAVFVSVLPIGAYLAMNGSLSYPVFITIMILALGIIGPIIAAVTFTDNIAQVGTTIGEVAGVLEEGELERPEKRRSITSYDIEAQHLKFAYQEKEVLHDVSFRIPAGSINALVGPSGGGKSTIARLLAGFWDPSGGSITIGQVERTNIPLEQWNDMIAYVSQDNYLFDTTIMENIRMGKKDASDQDVIAAAKACGCHDFIEQLSKGYQTVVGGAGGHLSGGERQRIAIARAMLKDAPIIILDEATAYTDPENEAIVQKAVAKLIKGKTLLVIAHRLSTIVDADQILLVESGKIQAVGTHQTLLQESSLYASMWKAHVGAKDSDQEREG